MSIATLTTERLIMRPVREEDAAGIDEYVRDPVAMRYVDPEGEFARGELWVERNLARYERDGCGFWALERREDGQFVGLCGLLVQEVAGETFLEIGYGLPRRAWGHGYATEAAIASRDHGFRTRGEDRIISIIHPDNRGSIRVAQRNGMELWRTVEFRWLREARLYAITRERWETLADTDAARSARPGGIEDGAA